MSELGKLPDSDKAWIEEQKIRKYLLDLTNSKGRPKAEYFMRRGFTLEQWQALSDALLLHGRTNDVAEVREREFGRHYAVECACRTPDGTNPCIRSVWEVKPDDPRPRLVTAYVF